METVQLDLKKKNKQVQVQLKVKISGALRTVVWLLKATMPGT